MFLLCLNGIRLPTETRDRLLDIQRQRQLRCWARSRSSCSTATATTTSSTVLTVGILAGNSPSRNVTRRRVQEGGGEGGRERGMRRRGAGRGGGGRLGGCGCGPIAGIRQRNRGVADKDRTADAIAAREIRDGPVHGLLRRWRLGELGTVYWGN